MLFWDITQHMCTVHCITSQTGAHTLQQKPEIK